MPTATSHCHAYVRGMSRKQKNDSSSLLLCPISDRHGDLRRFTVVCKYRSSSDARSPPNDHGSVQVVTFPVKREAGLVFQALDNPHLRGWIKIHK